MLLNSTERNEVDTDTDESHTDFTNLMEPDLRPWENSDPFVSAHTRYIIRMVLDCYLRQFILASGIPGNIICCIVFFKQGLSDRINLLLFWLAVADLINLVINLLSKLGCYIVYWDKEKAINWTTMMDSKVIYIGFWASFVSGGLIMIMSVDRCLSVVMPLKAGRLLSYRSILVAIFVTYLGLLIFHLPVLLVFTIDWRIDPLTNRSITYITTTDWFTLDINLSVEIMTIVRTILQPLFAIVVTFCSIITIVKLRQAFRKRLQMQGTGKQENARGDNQITKMMLLLCVVYVVLVLPEVGAQITYYIVPEFYAYNKFHNTVVVVYGVIFTASCLNSTINFCAYLMLSSKFRATLKELCQCCRGNHTPVSDNVRRHRHHRRQ